MKINKQSTQSGSITNRENTYGDVGAVNNFENGGIVIGSGASGQAGLQTALAEVLAEIGRARRSGTLTEAVAGSLEGHVQEALAAVAGPDADGQAAQGKLAAARQFLIGSGGAPAIVAALSAAINAANGF